jgi:hypothetical protein
MTWHERVGIGKRDPAARQNGAAQWTTAKRAAEERRHDITGRAQQARPGPTQEWTKAMTMTRGEFPGTLGESTRIFSNRPAWRPWTAETRHRFPREAC